MTKRLSSLKSGLNPKVHEEWVEDVQVWHSRCIVKAKNSKIWSHLWFPVEPDFDADELRAISDEYEVQRLIRKETLRVKRLSTKFVRT